MFENDRSRNSYSRFLSGKTMSKKIVDCDWFSYQFGRGFGAGLKRSKTRTYLSESIRNLFSRTRCRGIDIIII